MSEETLRILVEFFGAVLVAFMMYFFTRSHYERKRKDELADREFNRRAAIYDMRIDEARGSLDSYAEIFSKLKKFETELLEKGITPEKFVMFMREHHKRYAEITDLMEELSNNLHSLNLISDDELRDLLMSLNLNLLVETRNIPRIVAAIGGIELLNKEDELERVSNFSTNIHRLNTRIQARLDKLAQSDP